MMTAFAAMSLASCKKDPIRLVCDAQGRGERLAIEIEEDGSKGRVFDIITRNNLFEMYGLAVTPTAISFRETEASSPKWWQLDRVTGRVVRNDPFTEYNCYTGPRF